MTKIDYKAGGVPYSDDFLRQLSDDLLQLFEDCERVGFKTKHLKFAAKELVKISQQNEIEGN